MAQIHLPKIWRRPDREATPESVFRDRRAVLKTLGLGTLSLGLGAISGAQEPKAGDGQDAEIKARVQPAIGTQHQDKFPAPRNSKFKLPPSYQHTPESVASSHNNFYEFTTVKDKVWELAQDYPVESWKVSVGGLVEKPITLDLDDIFTRFPLEERVYCFRCVERWAMQVPWVGFPLRSLIDSLKPLSAAKYVKFTSFQDPKGLPGQNKGSWYPWPYFEGLRMDEVRNELAFVAVGTYGHALPMQHGAPWRLVLPWKYGFKSPKSIVKIEFVAERPGTFWNDTQPEEYGFYANVEPHKPHPLWSQRWEQDIGTGETRESMLYNGYSELVGSMYNGRES